MNENIELLKQYAEHGDQTAFAQIVESYINLAYSAALSCLGNADQAGDACQLTFLELSKKAGKLSDSVQLGGWIHATARHFSKKIQHSEARRQTREQRYVDDMNMQQDREPDWSRLMPEIHEAIDQLNAAEREAILLRFFQQKSLAEVGSVLGITADAARMRLNRALERLNRQMALRGISSTAAALAAALPTHAMVAAPAELAKTISTSVLAGAGVTLSGTSTLTGAVITIMKTKTVLISAVVATTAITGTGVYLSSRHTETAHTDHPSVSAPPAAVEPARVEPAAIQKTVKAETTDAFIPEPEPASLDIDPVYYRQAEQATGILEMALPMMGNQMVQAALAKQIENPSKKLRHRLSLDPEAVERFDEILAEHAATEKQRLQDAVTASSEALKNLLKTDREGLVNFVALQTMQKAGQPLSAAQEEYVQTYTKKMAENNVHMGLDAGNTQAPRQWYEVEEVIDSLNENLTIEQQEELAIQIEEQKNRKKEEAAYKRTNELANSLGLNEADRTALYKYLYQHPDATNEDITERVTPELRELMPNGAFPFGADGSETFPESEKQNQ
ncbi:sigma-70 family RNA polymerase sigma factor [Verrucomicrobia bacterium S94]|nr:sigma-70 family RNA polymerase sigma factor [Verrucomicrobia bacterium S94]